MLRHVEHERRAKRNTDLLATGHKLSVPPVAFRFVFVYPHNHATVVLENCQALEHYCGI